MTPSIPSLKQLHRLFVDETACITFLLEKGIFPSERECLCGAQMRLSKEDKLFRCPRKTCRKAVSIKKNSFFSTHKTECCEILHLAWMWLGQASSTFMECAADSTAPTVASLRKKFRQLVSDAVEVEDVMIGGEGITVEIDETKLGKRKYHRGHAVEGVWVLGGVERTPERRIFLVEVPNRSADLLTHIILNHVQPGSIICTDLWGGYNRLSETGQYEHLTVNHSENFKDPITGTHTNTIEGSWNALKMQIKPRNRVKGIEEHLWEFIWRRRNADRLWDAFIDALKDAYYE